jgi:16S rRNA (guanine(1405)-N(7))-methyltransferase
MNPVSSNIEALLAAVLESSKYRAVHVDAIRRIGQRELANRRNLKEAVKETKNTLHQMAGAFLDGKIRYSDLLETLRGASDLREACREVLAYHASTRERLPFLDTFYPTVLADIAPVHSILDVACGLNPLAAPFMPLAPDATYFACDLYSDMADFLKEFFALADIRGDAFPCDILSSLALTPGPSSDSRGGRAQPGAVLPVTLTNRVQVAFVLKLLPLLEQWDKAAGVELLRALEADYLLVSYPTRTLGGRGKGMGATYEARFRDMAQSEGWPYRRFEFPNELCFLVEKKRVSG